MSECLWLIPVLKYKFSNSGKVFLLSVPAVFPLVVLFLSKLGNEKKGVAMAAVFMTLRCKCCRSFWWGRGTIGLGTGLWSTSSM